MFGEIYSEIFTLIQGGIFILFVYHLIIYFQNKNKLYLYFSLYLLVFTLLFGVLYVYELSPSLAAYMECPIQFLGFVVYVEFSRLILDTRTKILFWDKYFEILSKIFLVLSFVFVLIQFFFGYESQQKLYIVIFPVHTILSVLCLYIVISKIKNNDALNYSIASLLYLIPANIIFFIILSDEIVLFKEYGFPHYLPVFLGALLQCLLLSVILGSKIREMEQRSKDAEVSLAVHLKEVEELKMIALQSQMNPHFIFNSLNSINNFVLKSEVEKASDYITKFSRLIRVILNSSTRPTSTLAEELGILSLYVKLEQMRVNGGFSYTVDIHESINLEVIKVPTLFLQPFIENSIWHGIMKKEGDKKIEVSIQKENNTIVCNIKDNGIGINKAKELTHMSQRRKFFGAKTTEDRIQILYRNKGVKIETKDISSSTSTGTLVSIRFPFE